MRFSKLIRFTQKGFILLFSTSTLLISSCATFNGAITTSASLSNPNFKYVKVVSGTAVGKLSVQALVAQAKANMYENYPLKDNQAYANICLDFKHVNLLLFTKQQVTVTADIVEFLK